MIEEYRLRFIEELRPFVSENDAKDFLYQIGYLLALYKIPGADTLRILLKLIEGKNVDVKILDTIIPEAYRKAEKYSELEDKESALAALQLTLQDKLVSEGFSEKEAERRAREIAARIKAILEGDSEKLKELLEDYVVLAEKQVGETVFKLVRVKGSPKLKLLVSLNGLEVWSKSFLIKQDIKLTEKRLNKILSSLEKKGLQVLEKYDDYKKALIEVIEVAPNKVLVPRISELNLAFRKIKVSEISTEYLYQPVEVEAQIVGASEFLSIPIRFEFICRNHGERRRITIDFTDPKKLEQILFKRKQLIKMLETKVNLSRFEEEEKSEKCKFIEIEERRAHIDLKIIKLRELPENVEKFSESLQYKIVDCFLIGQDLPRSKKVRIRGYVINRPQGNMNKLVLVAFDIEPLNEIVERFKVNQEVLNDIRDILPKAATVNIREQYRELKNIIDSIIAPKIVGRIFEKLATALALTSANEIVLESSKERFYGMLRVMHYGDTKTGKTETNRAVFTDIGLGDYVTCETGTRTGLLYTIDPEFKSIIWGAIPLCDREVCVVDGFNALPKEEMKEFREALEHFHIRVKRFVSGDAYARTRIIAIANPRKHMRKYAFNIEAAKDIPSLREEPDYTRFDLFIPWCSEDVDIEKIATSSRSRNTLLEEKFKKLCLIAWNATAIVCKKAEEEINSIVVEYVRKARGLDIPIVHQGWKKVVCKIAAAFACLLQKFTVKDNKVYVNVDSEAVAFTKLFLEEYFERLEVEEYLANFKKELSREEIEELLSNELSEKHGYKLILMMLYERKQASRAEIAQKLGMSVENLKKHYLPKLRKLDLIISKPGVGIVLTEKGEQVATHLYKKSGE
ncbi:MAG: hypothetical protein DRJ31_08730 [Candidatus Methanomethylicota archaeon]|uniref:MCM C-terminal AAA(+) ATPase domain-containing protein n=1 Tax=Thermoproteota archaeon TaxID=2056631 RepID=A0A497EN35_9CREN|nr:MAG: hypothetical protein DRJ31_08730 [Candidatus Verstraetearchaeota archaeon]